MQWVQWALPTSIPLLSLHQTPAHFLQSFVDNRIQSFQDGVDRRAAAQQADPRCADPARHVMLTQPVTCSVSLLHDVVLACHMLLGQPIA